MKEKIRGSLPDLLAILIGNLFLALTVVLFVLPGELISCGTTGLSLLAKALWGIPVSAFVLVFNMVMLILGWAVLGRKFAMTTIASSFLNPIFLELFQRLFAGQNRQKVRQAPAYFLFHWIPSKLSRNIRTKAVILYRNPRALSIKTLPVSRNVIKLAT